MTESKEPRSLQEKAISLIEYLIEVAKLRSKQVYDIKKYPEDDVLWLSDIPQGGKFFTHAAKWGQDKSHSPDAWVVAEKSPEPEPPKIPKEFEDWVVEDDLCNPYKSPELLPKIPAPKRSLSALRNSGKSSGKGKDSEYIYLKNYPDVKKRWEKYIEKEWKPRAESFKPSYIYKKLYRLYKSLGWQSDGYEYELALGIGLLAWEEPRKKGASPERRQSPERNRQDGDEDGQPSEQSTKYACHAIIADADIDFEPITGKITVKPHSNGSKLRIDDVVPLDFDSRRKAEKPFSTAKDQNNPWEKNAIQDVLNAIANSLGKDGEGIYKPDIKWSGDITKKPVVTFAPALIRRKRSEKNLMTRLEEIKGQIEKNNDIPEGIAKLIESAKKEKRSEAMTEDSSCEEEILFPYHSNDEQYRIVEMMRTSNGVVVQGPPGTGKSHTIANLMAYLLADGKRILVTAKKKDALKVLVGEDGKLKKEELRQLCICQFGDDSEDKNTLKKNIETILNKYRYWDVEEKNKDKILSCDNKLKCLKEKKKEIDGKLREIREKDTKPGHTAAKGYAGTAFEIAEKVESNREAYDWFTDDVESNEGTNPAFGPTHLEDNFKELPNFDSKKRDELKRVWPTAEDLLPPEEFAGCIAAIKMARERRQSGKSIDNDIVDSLINKNPYEIKEVHEKLSIFSETLKKLRDKAKGERQRWSMEKALNDILAKGGQSSGLSELFNETRNILTSIKPLAEKADKNKLTFSDGREIPTESEELRGLAYKNRPNGDRKLKFWSIITSPVDTVKNMWSIKDIKVNGQGAVKNKSQLISDVLYVHFECERAWNLWRGRVGKTGKSSSYAGQIEVIESMCDSLGEALTLDKSIEDCRDAIQKYFPSIKSIKPDWTNDGQIETLINSCSRALITIGNGTGKQKIKELKQLILDTICKDNPHNVSQELLNAVETRDSEKYENCVKIIKSLQDERKTLKKMDEYLNRLTDKLPKLVKDLKDNGKDPCWEERIKKINDAWEWAKARCWLKEYVGSDDIYALAEESKNIYEQINECVAELYSLKAWGEFIPRLQEKPNYIQHMQAYLDSSQDSTNRGILDAQKHLTECVEAIPAWIMPLDIVWNNIIPKPGMFDVVIVDEASQCGLEAVPLLYMAQKIVIVGDDKQITPEIVGDDKVAIQSRIDLFLYDFEFKSKFKRDSDLFNFGNHCYPTNKVALLEHFRCMPEIIKFSADNFYSNVNIDLIPLRPYGPDRLPPLEHEYVSGGRKDKEVNHKEVDAIVEKIKNICDDPRYYGKTIGVIPLHVGQGKQAKAINDKLSDKEKSKIKCDVPSSFQGDERDIILLSLVVGPDESPLSETKHNQQRFNVAASRARDQMILFHSVNKIKENCLRGKLLKFFIDGEKKLGRMDSTKEKAADELEKARKNSDRKSRLPKGFKDGFEVDVALELHRKKYKIIPQFEIAKSKFDFAVEGERAIVAVMCDGGKWEGEKKYDEEIKKQRKLERCGWKIFRVRGSAFYADREKCLKPILDMLKERGIKPEN